MGVVFNWNLWRAPEGTVKNVMTSPRSLSPLNISVDCFLWGAAGVPDRSQCLPPGILHRSSRRRWSPGRCPVGCTSLWGGEEPSQSAAPHLFPLEAKPQCVCVCVFVSVFIQQLTFLLCRSPAGDPAHGSILKLLPVVWETDGFHQAYRGEHWWTTTPRRHLSLWCHRMNKVKPTSGREERSFENVI